MPLSAEATKLLAELYACAKGAAGKAIGPSFRHYCKQGALRLYHLLDLGGWGEFDLHGVYGGSLEDREEIVKIMREFLCERYPETRKFYRRAPEMQIVQRTHEVYAVLLAVSTPDAPETLDSIEINALETCQTFVKLLEPYNKIPPAHIPVEVRGGLRVFQGDKASSPR